MVEPINGVISPWMPETDTHTLAAIGKLAEEANELAGRIARIVIQGLEGIDPDSGKTNREEVEREIADVEAAVVVAKYKLGLTVSDQRRSDKISGFYRWHDLIDKELEK